MRIIGIRLYKGVDSVVKNLKPGWYPLGNYQEPKEENNWQWQTEEQRKNEECCNKLYKSVAADDPFEDRFQITVNSIVGTNGSGKTTLLELYFRIINNLSYYLFDKSWDRAIAKGTPLLGHDMHPSTGFEATLFFETDGYLGEIKSYEGGATYIYRGKEEMHVELPDHNNIKSNSLRKMLGTLFYTICSNYSIYSLNEDEYGHLSILRDYEKDIDSQWISGILHKNDGYLAPIVMVPYREEGNFINVMNEMELAKQRLSTLALLFLSQGKPFMAGYEAAELEYAFRLEASQIYENSLNKILEKKLLSKRDEIKEEIRISWIDWLMATEGFNEKPDHVKDAILSYMTYKTIKICLTYREFGQKMGLRKSRKEDFSPGNHSSHEEEKMVAELRDGFAANIVGSIMKEKEPTHITLKLHQMIEYIRRSIYKADEKMPINKENSLGIYTETDLKSFLNRNLQHENLRTPEEKARSSYKTYDEVFLILPPAIFEWEVKFKKKGAKEGDELVTLDKMSSGEKQFMQSFSYILYHIKNLQSVDENTLSFKYHHVALVFDEAELYYHPEFQRDFISRIIEMLAWCHIDERRIRSVNIIVVTHSPFVLSDVMGDHTLNMSKGKVEHYKKQTFGANIHELLYDQFIEDSIGAVVRKAVSTISNLYKDYQRTRNKEAVRKELLRDYDYYQFLASTMAEPFLRRNLTSMLEEMLTSTTKLERMEAEYKVLLKRQEELRNAIEKERQGNYEED